MKTRDPTSHKRICKTASRQDFTIHRLNFVTGPLYWNRLTGLLPGLAELSHASVNVYLDPVFLGFNLEVDIGRTEAVTIEQLAGRDESSMLARVGGQQPQDRELETGEGD